MGRYAPSMENYDIALNQFHMLFVKFLVEGSTLHQVPNGV